jgi:hypothetical protein
MKRLIVAGIAVAALAFGCGGSSSAPRPTVGHCVFTPSNKDDEAAIAEAVAARRAEADRDPSECPLGASWQTVRR